MIGSGEFVTTVITRLQTFSFVPEPSSTLLAAVAGGVLVFRAAAPAVIRHERRSRRFFFLVLSLAGLRLDAETIPWFSDANKTNLDSSGVPMDAGYHFELGVFAGGFVPKPLNGEQWAAHWVAADTTVYCGLKPLHKPPRGRRQHRAVSVGPRAGSTAP